MSLPIFPLLMIAVLIGVPIVELMLLIEVGGELGALTTVALVILTAVIGVWLVQRQGVAILFRLRETVDRGEPPAVEMLEGALVLFAGLLLLVPGFATDTLGFLLLVPALRLLIVRAVVRRFRVNAAVVRREQSVIEGDWRRED